MTEITDYRRLAVFAVDRDMKDGDLAGSLANLVKC